eukprot:CAMPEP_0196253346 /NCGR_PEP_ID=MMETSP0913-20130531/51611_1 /TAXON_ID=49265 /ORGANISM="Thalassiosira rotula, Strain GSO102" /LENGTH=84 /DNA_ID=CAMNT_0041540279 /DNA_START=17 /DNA_END=267 /DNA_ORIENTATION=+
MQPFESDVEIRPGHDTPVKSGVVHLRSTSLARPPLNIWSSDLSTVAANAVPFTSQGYDVIETTRFSNKDLWAKKYGPIAPLTPG